VSAGPNSYTRASELSWYNQLYTVYCYLSCLSSAMINSGSQRLDEARVCVCQATRANADTPAHTRTRTLTHTTTHAHTRCSHPGETAVALLERASSAFETSVPLPCQLLMLEDEWHDTQDASAEVPLP
jgi:hypothetical protein